MSTKNAKESELHKILIESNPVLFLGAGFSMGSFSETGCLPKGLELRDEIFEKFVCGQVDKKEEAEIKEYNLQDICQCVYDYLGKKEELKKYILNRFKNVKPEEHHLLLTSYPWKRIYTVNVDDLVENIYRKNDISIIVQNRSTEKIGEADSELIKLHGCVNAPEESIVFSKSEYTTLIKDKNFKLDKLATDIVNQDVIFVGTSLDESDIDYYISQYTSVGFLRKGKLVFINPNPDVKLKARIRSLNGILLEWTTKDFLEYIAKINYNPTVIEKSRKLLNYYGLYLYQDLKDCLSVDIPYESRLYEGYNSTWRDVFEDWIFETSHIKQIKRKCDLINYKETPNFCIAIYGNRFVGKDCALKLIGANLYKEGYEVIEFRGKALNIKVIKNYILASSNKRFALLIENGSYYYGLIEKLLQDNFGTKQLLIITTSRKYYHFRKKYYLEDNPYDEYEIKESIRQEDAEIIYDKISEKGYLGELSLNRATGSVQIRKKGSYINLFSDLTYGNGFRQRIKGINNEIFRAPEYIRLLYSELSVFDKADLPYYPAELLAQQYSIDFNIFIQKDYSKLTDEQRLIVDYITIDINGIVLKNRLLIDAIWDKLDGKHKLATIKRILLNISSYVSEQDNTYWRIIFESLMKEDILSKEFGICNKDILSLYYSLKKCFEGISYYWLQLGIAEQKSNDYSKALNHLKMAHQIRPRAYQIQHAIARNYLKHSNEEENKAISFALFETGEKMMLEIINSKENYKAKAKSFSIHCYIHEKIKHMNKHPELVSKKECINLKKYIDMILGEVDVYSRGLVKEYIELLEKNKLLSAITMKPGDIYFSSLNFRETEKYNLLLDEDYVLDSY